ncbi:MAG: hypothetical protein U1E57_05590 [Paenacidovorax caeni]
MNTGSTQAPALVQRLVQAHGAQWVGLDDAEAFTAGPGARVLFFCSDPGCASQGLDVAVVLPELHAALGRSFAIGAVPADCEDLGLGAWCAALACAGVLPRRPVPHHPVGHVRLDDSCATCAAGAAHAASRRPGIGIPVVTLGADSHCH